MNYLRTRAIEDVLIVVCEALTCLPAAIEAVWSDALAQTCIVHLTRASLRWVKLQGPTGHTLVALRVAARAADSLVRSPDPCRRTPRHTRIRRCAAVVRAGDPALVAPRMPTAARLSILEAISDIIDQRSNMKNAISRKAVAALTLTCIGAIPLAGVTILTTTGSASAAPMHGWCWDDDLHKKVPCDN